MIYFRNTKVFHKNRLESAIDTFVLYSFGEMSYSQQIKLKIVNAMIDNNRQKESILGRIFCPKSDTR